MTNERYDLLMREFDKITGKVNKLAPSAQESGFNALVSALFNGMDIVDANQNIDSEATHKQIVVGSIHSNGREDRDYIAEIKRDVDRFNLKSVGVRFAKYAVYYLTRIAPDGQRLESVTPDDLKKIWKIVGVKPPAHSDYGKPLNNAKADGHLDILSPGHFVMTDIGEYYVKNDLMQSKS